MPGLTELFPSRETIVSPWRFFENTPRREGLQSNRIAIIIDDLGYHPHWSRQSARLPGQVTLAVIPYSPYAARVAVWASQASKELMLHVPMQPHSSVAWVDGLTSAMEETQLRTRLNDMLDSVPNVRGVNNHMGSALTENRTAMAWVMEELGKRRLYFVDSRTSVKTQAEAAARRQMLPNTRRDVFLDNSRKTADITEQFEKLVQLAEQRGSAIAIGHPYPETISFLQEALPTLRARGIELVPVSELVSPPLNAGLRLSQAE